MKCKLCPRKKVCHDVCYGENPCDFALAIDKLARKIDLKTACIESLRKEKEAMIQIDSYKLATNLLNSTLGIDDLPMEVHGRLATALVLLDHQDEEDFHCALRDAYGYLQKDVAALENLICKEGSNTSK